MGFKPTILGFPFLERRGSDFTLHTEQAEMLFPLYAKLRFTTLGSQEKINTESFAANIAE